MVIRVEMLRCFAAVARSGSLAAGAQTLGRTPSAVSMMLKQFEAHLGSPLFETERKSRLTALGMFTLDEATRELDHFERTVANIQAFAGSRAGLVRVATVPSVAETILPQVVQAFLQDRPGVRIDIRDMDSAGVLREIERERVDLGFASADSAGETIVRDELFSDAFGVVCRADHPLAAADGPLNWQALAPWPFIANGLCVQIADAGFQRVYGGSQLMVRNTTSLLALVRAGVGITVLPQLVAARASNELAFVRAADGTARRHIHLLHSTQASQSPAARHFERAIRRIAREIADGW